MSAQIIDLAEARQRRAMARRCTEVDGLIWPMLAAAGVFQVYLATLHRLQQMAARGLMSGGIDDLGM